MNAKGPAWTRDRLSGLGLGILVGMAESPECERR
jgi:hypothetical protein